MSIKNKSGQLSIPIEAPYKWDAEHPNLYKLIASLMDDGEELERKTYPFGFREVKIEGNKLLVNGKPVKLRGANRHDLHPLLGRTTKRELDKQDVLLAKEANINFIRTSHYPPSDAFLQYCDQYGIYVEDETAVCFVETHRDPPYQKVDHYGPMHRDQHLSQIKEMLNAHRNHPSVIIWSTGNESKYSQHFQMAYDFLKSEDPTRPVIFSYPGTVPDSVRCYDILSMHYPGYKGDLNQGGFVIRDFEYTSMPVLFDEWAHVACYNNPTLAMDPNVRNFWGQSLDLMWEKVFNSEGGLGGAIWGYIDETFMLPDELLNSGNWWEKIKNSERGSPQAYPGKGIGYGAWGIIDSWRRKKPEFWNTKKAYSPTKILTKRIMDFKAEDPLLLPVHNRFDHTDFSELRIVWTYKADEGILQGIKLEPHEKGTITVPANNWIAGEKLGIKFYQNDTVLIDCYSIPIGTKMEQTQRTSEGVPELTQSKSYIDVNGRGFKIRFSKSSGLIESISSEDKVLLNSGPLPNCLTQGKRMAYNLRKLERKDSMWELVEITSELGKEFVLIRVMGKYDKINAEFGYRIYQDGIIKLNYSFRNLPGGNKVQELGLMLTLPKSYTDLSWKRDAYWTCYPQGHPGANEGKTSLSKSLQAAYRSKPTGNWEDDAKSYYYNSQEWDSQLTNTSRATKEHIFAYTLTQSNGAGIRIHANGDKACRLEEQGESFLLYAHDKWDYTNLSWGNYMNNINTPESLKGSFVLEILGAD
jgi:hypothetical protein